MDMNRPALPLPRRLSIIAVPLAAAVGSAALYRADRARLPDPVATHWGWRSANGHSSLAAALALAVAVPAVTLALGVVLSWRADDHGQRAASAVAGTVSGFGLGLAFLTVVSNHHATVWSAADFAWALLPVAFGLAAAGGQLAWIAAGPMTPITPVTTGADREPSLGLSAGEHAVWTGGADNPSLAVLGYGFVIAAGTAAPLFGAAWPAEVLVAVIVATALIGCSSAHARAGSDGFTVRFGPQRWPSLHIALADIDHVEAIEIEPLRWGGWGYRIRPGRHARAVVIRRGPGVVIHTTDGRQLAVTCDDAATAAGLLNDLTRRR
jgi:hypothetical protein